ncbi:MAG: SpoIIE family protein phosphatase [Myxococcota bacterium]|nr:SpoIIE family protein phosphatase [Myxococcota bacterium]
MWVCLFAPAVPALAKSRLDQGIPLIRNFDIEAGEVGQQNWDLAQDKRGILYSANERGLLTYDGNEFRLIEIPNWMTTRSVAVDETGTVYVGDNGEFGYLASDATGKLAYTSLSVRLDPKENNFKDIWRIYITSSGIYFFAVSKIFRFFENQLTSISMTGKNWASQVGEDIYVYHFNGGISRLVEGELRRLPDTDQFSFKENGFVTILPYQRDQLLLATGKKGCVLYPLQGGASLAIPGVTPEHPTPVVEPFPTELEAYLRDKLLYVSAVQTLRGDYVFGTSTHGLVVMNRQGELTHVIDQSQGLVNDYVTDLIVDAQGDLWVATTAGISHVALSSPWSTFDLPKDKKANIWSLKRHQSSIYLGTDNGVFYLPSVHFQLEHQPSRFLPIDGLKGEFGTLNLTKDAILAIDYGNIFQIQGAKSEHLLAPEGMDRITAEGTTDRFPDVVFLANRGKGLLAIQLLPVSDNSADNREKGTNTRYRAKRIDFAVPQVAEMSIRYMTQDKHGHLWLSTDRSGIFHLRFLGQDIREFDVVHYTTEHGLPSMELNMVSILNGQPVVAKNTGIYRYESPTTNKREPNPSPGRFVRDPSLSRYFQEHGMELWSITTIGDALLANANGSVPFAVQKKRSNGSLFWDERPFRPITRATVDHMHSWQVDRDGILWVSSAGRVYRYDHKVKKDYCSTYTALVRRVTVNRGEPLFQGAFYDPAVKDPAGHYPRVLQRQQPAQIPVLAYDKNSLRFEYATTFFEAGDKNQFAYKLDGFDEAWSEWTTDKKKGYTNLPAGSYRFRVKAKNVFLHESKEAQYRFVIRPPWYQTYWAYAGFAVCFLLLLFGLVQIYTWRLRRSKKRLEAEVKERTAEVVVQKEEIKQANDALWGEMQLAKKIQTVLLPTEPHIPGYEISAYTMPADEVGGDYYDIINAGNRDWIIIGDVSGHGVSAGLVMMMTQTAINTALAQPIDFSPSELLIIVNRAIRKNITLMREDKYMTLTAFAAHDNGTLHFAGLHQNVIIYRSQSQAVEIVETNGIWLGIADDMQGMLTDEKLQLNVNDVVLLFTDGITEAQKKNGPEDTEIAMVDTFGNERLKDVFQSAGDRPTEEIKETILRALQDYESDDDITLVIIKRVE